MKCFICKKNIGAREEHVKANLTRESWKIIGEYPEVYLRICMSCYKEGTDNEDRIAHSL